MIPFPDGPAVFPRCLGIIIDPFVILLPRAPSGRRGGRGGHIRSNFTVMLKLPVVDNS